MPLEERAAEEEGDEDVSLAGLFFLDFWFEEDILHVV